MRAMIGNRISAVVFLSVPVLALWALSPVWSASRAPELMSLAVLAGDDVVGDAAVGDSTAVTSTEPITDLSDWTYTADPMSPTGKAPGSFTRRLLSTTQPGHHATPAGPNPRVPWLTRPESLGDPSPSNTALMVPAFMSAYAPQGSTGTVTPGNVQNFATPNTKSTSSTGVAPQNLVASQNLSMLQNVAASQTVQPFAFQPVKASSPSSVTRRLGLGGNN